MMAIDARIVSILKRAEELASLLPDLQIDTSHVFHAIYEESDSVSAQILRSFGVTPERLQVALFDVRAKHQAAAPQAATHRSADWEQRIEQQLTRIETELAAIRSMLSQPSSSITE
jgi:ATP-dependent Clp protease ATP-binding subunit ClpA